PVAAGGEIAAHRREPLFAEERVVVQPVDQQRLDRRRVEDAQPRARGFGDLGGEAAQKAGPQIGRDSGRARQPEAQPRLGVAIRHHQLGGHERIPPRERLGERLEQRLGAIGIGEPNHRDETTIAGACDIFWYLRDMPVYAITGSSGYVGTRMTRRLLESPDNRVIGFDVRPPRIDSDRLEFHQMDVRYRRIAAVLKGRGVHSLLHFAFVLDPFYDEKEMTDIDLGGTRNVLDAVLAAGIPHLLATSSTTAYGALPDNPVPLDERAPTRAGREFIYAHDKRLMDEMLRDFAAAHPDLKVCIVRPCIVLGPNVANYIAVNLIAPPAVVLLDGADVPLQFVHEDDLVELIATLLK